MSYVYNCIKCSKEFKTYIKIRYRKKICDSCDPTQTNYHCEMCGTHVGECEKDITPCAFCVTQPSSFFN